MSRTSPILIACVLLASCAGRHHIAGWEAADDRAFAKASSEAPSPGRSPGRGPGCGASPGDEHGPGGFVPRRDARSFYAASGGQLWYYLNLYYWAPEGIDRKDLWIRAEVIERFGDLRRWPDAVPAAAPAPKTTIEYWAVGASGRTMTIDNHKDFFLASENWCAGAIDVTISLELGRLRVRDEQGAWARPRARYVLAGGDYGKRTGIGEDNVEFTRLEREPVTVWAYRIPWSTWPEKLVRSGWESLAVPELRLVRRVDPTPPERRPVLTDDR